MPGSRLGTRTLVRGGRGRASSGRLLDVALRGCGAGVGAASLFGLGPAVLVDPLRRLARGGPATGRRGAVREGLLLWRGRLAGTCKGLVLFSRRFGDGCGPRRSGVGAALSAWQD